MTDGRKSQALHDARAMALGLAEDLDRLLGPPTEPVRSRTELVLAFSLVRGTRGYIERVVMQINGCYEKGWYDACAVMIRRLLETLIIECFENYKIADKIKSGSGDFLYLSDLIAAVTKESAWNLGRKAKAALPRLKEVGDQSAHSRRFIAHRSDLDKLLPDLRIAVQELLALAALK